MAGIETTSTTIHWACLYLLENQDIQDRMRKEITKVVGTDRRPTFSDKPNLPYCEAVITETQRLANVLPLSGPRKATDDEQWYGYTIPKGALIINSLESIHLDPEVFQEPLKFKPERFLTDEASNGLKDNIMPFGAGKYFITFKSSEFKNICVLFVPYKIIRLYVSRCR